jgi:hypothetical protein
VMAFAVYYASRGALGDLLRGVLILPQRRLVEANLALPPLGTVALAVPYGALLIPNRQQAWRRQTLWTATLAAVLVAVLWWGGQPIVYGAVWVVARDLPLLAAIGAAWRLDRRAAAPQRSDVLLFLLASIGGTVALVQFPYATPTYFYYCAPLTALALVALVASQPFAPTRLHACIGLFFLVFALVFANRTYGWNLGVRFLPYDPVSRLSLDRGGLWVPTDDAREYETLVAVLREHAAGGTIYAAPDCPEVYFLSGFRNPTPSLFEFLSPGTIDVRGVSDLLTRTPIRAVVINRAPLFSPSLGDDVIALVSDRFPESQTIGRFVVRYR